MPSPNTSTYSGRDRLLLGGFIGVVLTLVVLRLATWNAPATRDDARDPSAESSRIDDSPSDSALARSSRESLPDPVVLKDESEEADIEVPRSKGLSRNAAPTEPALTESATAPKVRLAAMRNTKMREPTASEVLKKMIAAYQAAKGYSDKGKLTLKYRQRGETASESWPMAVQLFRPGRLKIDAYQLHIVSDAVKEKKFLARVEDESSGNIDNQVVSREAPAKITLDELSRDPILMTQLASRLQRPPVQLEMLLAEKPLAGLFSEDTKLTLLSKSDIDKNACRRVEAAAPDGKFVFWIDEKTNVLRRVEFPAALFLPEAASDPTVKDLTLIAELTDAKFLTDGSGLDLSFKTPAKAKLVKAFVPPPVQTAPHLLGKRLPEVSFTTPRGKKVAASSWRGKPTAMMWFMGHPACEAAMKQFTAAAEATGDKARFIAVCTDPTSTTTSSIEALLKEWRTPVEWIRDSEAAGESKFKIDAVPALVITDAEGTVQTFVVQGDPNLSRWLPDVLARIAGGEDIAGEIKKLEKKTRDEYEKLIASGGPTLDATPPPVVEPRKASQPRKLTLEELWTCKEVKSPGNLYIQKQGDQKEGNTDWKVLALDGFRTLVEIDAEGKVTERHELDLPEKAAVTTLRFSPSDASATYVAAFAPMGPQVFVFDRKLRLQYAYPASAEEAESPIRDVQLADLKNEEDSLAYVAFADASGLQGLDAKGNRAWRSRAYDPLFSIAVSPRDELLGQRLLVTGRGGVMPVNSYGNNDPEIRVPNWVVGQIMTGHFSGAKQAALCALAVDDMERSFAVGLDPQLAEQWNYPLPSGPFAKPIDPVTSSPWLDGKGHWVFAGPDGSIHIISEDGEFNDFYATGEHLAGLATARVGDESLLLLSSDQGVKAFRVTVK
jgi:hypothetical protein